MQILTRMLQETVRIGLDTTVTVIHIRGDQVRLRIHTPGAIRAYKQEIVTELNQAATQALSRAELSTKRPRDA